LPVRVHAADRGYQLVATEGLLQEFTGPGQHGAPEGLILASMERRITPVLGRYCTSISVVWMPSMPGSPASTTATSGWVRRASWRAVSPSPATAQTVRSSSWPDAW